MQECEISSPECVSSLPVGTVQFGSAFFRLAEKHGHMEAIKALLDKAVALEASGEVQNLSLKSLSFCDIFWQLGIQNAMVTMGYNNMVFGHYPIKIVL